MAEQVNKSNKKCPGNNKSPRRGDPCPDKKCPGKLTAYSQSRTENGKIYFLSCARCNSKPKNNKEVITTGEKISSDSGKTLLPKRRAPTHSSTP